MLREGLLERPTSAAKIGYARLANALRRVPIGFGLARYHDQLTRAVEAAKRDADRKASAELEYRGDRGSQTLAAVLATIEPLIRLAPQATHSAIEVLELAKQLMSEVARTDCVLDRYARAKLIDDINGMRALLRSQPQAPLNIRAWLENLPQQSRLFSSTPRPGRLHLAPLEQGGASGRPLVYVLGLDDRKFPKRQAIDPLLLNGERERISPDLITSDQLSEHQSAAIDRLLQRLEGVPKSQVVFARSLRDLVDDSESFASPVLLRLLSQNSTPPTESIGPVSFIAAKATQTITASESHLRRWVLSLTIQCECEICTRSFHVWLVGSWRWTSNDRPP